jgi:hypothetical protein
LREFSILLRHVAKRILQKILSMKKIKMLKKGLFMVESIVTIGSFDYDCTFMSMKKMDSLNVAIELWRR